MSARRHISAGQLSMFMSAREIVSAFQPAEHERMGETDEEMWQRKRAESADPRMVGRGFIPSVLREGVHTPVHVADEIGSSGRPQVGEGHHRIITEAVYNPDRLMPILHHKTIGDVGNYVMDYE